MSRIVTTFFAVLGLISIARATPLPDGMPVRGWTLLSDSEADDMVTLAAARSYDINHVQLSHDIVMNLRELDDAKKLALVNRLIDASHAAGATEVVLWDHALYNLNYYPEEFKTGPGNTIDLDNPKFWDWLKADYRRMLDKVPHADGIVLTFIETGARAERQSSQKLKTNQEKLAAVVDAVADVVCNERRLNLYARTFAYTYAEYDNLIGAIKLMKNPHVRLMMKETPHDFFLTHPNDKYAGTIDRPTLMEFDAAGEFNGQGVIATTWPQYILKRWSDFAKRPHIIGYTARTDRYNDTRLVGRPGEIDLLALKRGAENPDISPEAVYDEFITAHYGAAALPEVKAAFKNAFDIVTCTIYTLGTNVASHSTLECDPSNSSFVLHCSGKWHDPPVVKLGHGIDKEFHYWRDIDDHIAPPCVKQNTKQWNEVPNVTSAGWIHPDERMDGEYLKYIVTEKNFGVTLAEESLKHIENAKASLSPENYQQLHELFERTLLTAKLHRGVASAYYGFRVWSRGEFFHSDDVKQTTQAGLDEIKQIAPQIRDYPGQVPKGQWNWCGDADRAEKYLKQITEGWPKETNNIANPYGGMKFP